MLHHNMYVVLKAIELELAITPTLTDSYFIEKRNTTNRTLGMFIMRM